MLRLQILVLTLESLWDLTAMLERSKLDYSQMLMTLELAINLRNSWTRQDPAAHPDLAHYQQFQRMVERHLHRLQTIDRCLQAQWC